MKLVGSDTCSPMDVKNIDKNFRRMFIAVSDIRKSLKHEEKECV